MTATKKCVNMDDDTDCHDEVNNSEPSIVAATRVAYYEFLDYIGGGTEDYRPGKIKEVESKIVHEGTSLKINFEIDYITDGVTMDCVAIVLENLEKEFDVDDVTCECCLDEGASKIINVTEYNVPQ